MKTKNFTSDLPTEEGNYWLISEEHEEEPEFVAVFAGAAGNRKTLFCELTVGAYSVEVVQAALTGVKWAQVFSSKQQKNSNR